MSSCDARYHAVTCGSLAGWFAKWGWRGGSKGPVPMGRHDRRGDAGVCARHRLQRHGRVAGAPPGIGFSITGVVLAVYARDIFTWAL